MTARSRLPGGARRSSRVLDPWVATPLLVLSALLLSSFQMPAADRGGRDALAATADPLSDSLSIQVTPAYRAEFLPTEGEGAVHRSRLFRIEVTLGSVAPPDRLTLVVGREPEDPMGLASMMRAQRAGGTSAIHAPRREPGAPAVHDVSGWSAWDVALRPAVAPAIGAAGTPHTGLTDPRRQVFGAISVDSATVAACGGWIGLFDDAGRRIGTAQIPPVTR